MDRTLETNPPISVDPNRILQCDESIDCGLPANIHLAAAADRFGRGSAGLWA